MGTGNEFLNFNYKLRNETHHTKDHVKISDFAKFERQPSSRVLKIQIKETSYGLGDAISELGWFVWNFGELWQLTGRLLCKKPNQTW